MLFYFVSTSRSTISGGKSTLISRIIVERELFELKYNHIYFISSTDIENYRRLESLLAAQNIETTFLSYAEIHALGFSESLTRRNSIIIFDDSFSPMSRSF